MTLAELISARSVPGDRSGVAALDRNSIGTTTRGELLERAGRLGSGLATAGLKHGDRVVIMAPNSADWIVSALGVMDAGGVVVPLDVQMPSEDLAHALADCDPGFIFTTPALRERIEALDLDLQAQLRLFGDDADDADAWSALLAPEPSEPVAADEDLAAIFYTSGTTGPPKGVPLTHRNLSSNVEALCEQGLADHTDRILVPLPFHHVYPFTVGILIPLTLGAPIIIPFSLVGAQIVRALREGEATVMLGVPRLYEAVWSALEERIAGRGRLAAALFHGLLGVSMAARRRLGWRLGRRMFAGLHKRLAPDLRLVVSGGAALDPDLGRRLQGLGWEIATGYGLSETSPILTFNPPDRIRLESAGIALPGVELRIDARDGPGEVLARGPNVFGGYWNLPEKTAEDLDEDGWFHTGDTGELDDDGYLYLRGRESAMIVLSGGENVDPERVEKALAAADDIREAGVLAHEDRLAAVVVPEPRVLRESSGEALRERVEKVVEEAARELPSHHRPGMVRIALDPLPRTRLGKLRRHKLEELFERLGESDDASEAAPEPVSRESMSPEDQQLLSDPAAEGTWNYLAKRFHDLRLTPDSGLSRDLGIDSLGWVDLSLALREHAGIELDDSAIARVSTVRELLREAAGSAEAGEGSEDLAQALESPEELLELEHEQALAPPGPMRRMAGRMLLGLLWFATRLLLRVEIRGRMPENGPYLIAPRHLSALDPLVLIRALSARQLESLYWAGWTGLMFSGRLTRWFSRTARILPIDPGAAPRSSLALAATALKRGHTLIWFPEGQRSPDGALQKFRPGIGVVLRAQPVPVIPVWIEGTREAMPPGRILPHPGRVRVIIGEPIDSDSYGRDEREIVENLHSKVAALGDNKK
ncbi:AMP-binding protein [Thioalkalivibrio thiocyanodenitrificans]|uniref:AMP-binding protein n=1 Tax=Thioalkalivibrio thiocyanodenitrificans TaxID=243063 RepID=UPI000374E2DE|nr:AMP-binding protein [Thioalkalivibrio thiocyanodenitrificans]